MQFLDRIREDLDGAEDAGRLSPSGRKVLMVGIAAALVVMCVGAVPLGVGVAEFLESPSEPGNSELLNALTPSAKIGVGFGMTLSGLVGTIALSKWIRTR